MLSLIHQPRGVVAAALVAALFGLAPGASRLARAGVGPPIPVPPTDAASREWSVFNASSDALTFARVTSREWSVYNTEAGEVPVDHVVSREWSVYNRSVKPFVFGDVHSRQWSTFNRSTMPIAAVDVIAREFTINNESTPAVAFTTAHSREFTIYQPAPDLVVTSLSVPAELNVGDTFTFAYSVANSGSVDATGTWVDRVYLSDDDQLGGDSELRAYVFNGPLAPGETYSRAEIFQLPATPGVYHLFVVVDADVQLDEGDGNANNVASATMDAGGVDYSTTVSADTHAAPAGTPVTLRGTATWLDTLEPAAHVAVAVRVRVKNTRREYFPVTDDNGDYALVFDPAPGEAGAYTVFADHPLVLEDPASPDDAFTLYGMSVEPDHRAHTIVAGEVEGDSVALRNLGDTPLTGIVANVIGAPPGVTVDVDVPEFLAPVEAGALAYTLTTQAGVQSQSVIQVDVTSSEGASASLSLPVQVRLPAPILESTPTELSTGMVRGGQRFIDFDVTNLGGLASAPLDVVLPNAGWMSVTSSLPADPIDIGESTTITLRLAPPDDLPLGEYTGTIRVQDGTSFVDIPYSFVAQSTALGGLDVYATDEFTYWGDDHPPVAGAEVTVRDAVTNATVATGVTDASGHALFSDLVEAYYDVTVTADDHGTFRGTELVSGGNTRQLEAFLTRQLVTYQWSVFPTTIEDNYLISLEAVFETTVPAPVVTIEPASVDLRVMQGGTMQVDFTVTNHGLITADDLRLSIGSHPRYEFSPLFTEIGDLAAQTSVVIPVVIRDTQYQSNVAGGSCAAIRFEIIYSLVCGVRRNYGVPVFFATPNGGQCGGAADAYVFPGACSSNCAINPGGAPTFSEPLPCNSCSDTSGCRAALITCALGFTPLGCPISLVQSCQGDLTVANLKKCVIGAIKGCAVGAIPVIGQFLGPAVNLYDCLQAIPCACDCDAGDDSYENPNCSEPTIAGVGAPLDYLIEEAHEPRVLDLTVQLNRMATMLNAAIEPFGDSNWLRAPSEEDEQVLSDWLSVFDDLTNDGTEDGERLSDNEQATLLALPLPSHLTLADAEKFIARWNRTIDYEDLGIHNVDDVPEGMSTDFIARDSMEPLVSAALDAEAANAAEGHDDLMGGVIDAMNALAIAEQPLYPAHVIAGPAHGPTPNPGDGIASPEDGICARVRIRIEQEAVISRSAFAATFELENASDVDSLDTVTVTLIVKDENGAIVNDLFGIPAPTVTGLADLDGNDSLGPESTASGEWLIIPTSEAAPAGPVVYSVSGELTYELNGELIVVPLYPADITVLPNADLDLDYFLERIVYSDDPFTPQVEPAVPFSLGLIVQNHGAGEAGSVHITSAQPEIIENERGLLIDFKLIGSRVGLSERSPSLTVNLGNIPPGGTQVAQWLMTTTLQGQFIEYSATFQHLDSLGDYRLSLIHSVNIHELTHVVRVDLPVDDNLPDFLTNDTADPLRLADTIHSSDGTTLPVTAILDAMIDAPPTGDDLTVEVTTPTTPSGWCYIRLDEPSTNRYQLERVVRSDGRELLLGDNAWQTSRIVRPPDDPDYPEDFLHLVDLDTTGTYTVYYRPFPDVDDDDVPDDTDNCVDVPNTDQTDTDQDGVGDACDNCPTTVNVDQTDTDNDQVGDACDNCVVVFNPNQANADTDAYGDACDNCPLIDNDDQLDADSDHVGNACDNCPAVANTDQADFDEDAVGDVCDNCPCLANVDQADVDLNGVGDACESPNEITSSDPPDGAVDAREATDPTGVLLFGWNSVDISFAMAAGGVSASDFVLTELGGDGVPPGVAGIALMGPNTIQLQFDDRIEPGTRLVITHKPSCTRTCLASLPGDVGGDGASSASDILDVIDNLNGILNPPLAVWQCDVDRSGVCNSTDILEVIDLLNGAGAHRKWNNAHVPDCLDGPTR